MLHPVAPKTTGDLRDQRTARKKHAGSPLHETETTNGPAHDMPVCQAASSMGHDSNIMTAGWLAWRTKGGLISATRQGRRREQGITSPTLQNWRQRAVARPTLGRRHGSAAQHPHSAQHTLMPTYRPLQCSCHEEHACLIRLRRHHSNSRSRERKRSHLTTPEVSQCPQSATHQPATTS